MQQLSSSPPDVLASQYQLGMLRGTYADNKALPSVLSLIILILFLAVLIYVLNSMGFLFSWPFSLLPLLIMGAIVFRFISSAIRNYRQRGHPSASMSMG